MQVPRWHLASILTDEQSLLKLKKKPERSRPWSVIILLKANRNYLRRRTRIGYRSRPLFWANFFYLRCLVWPLPRRSRLASPSSIQTRESGPNELGKSVLPRCLNTHPCRRRLGRCPILLVGALVPLFPAPNISLWFATFRAIRSDASDIII
jgi:hypothetical protein